MAAASLHGKTALVTGAGKRLGRAIALVLAGEGANIVIHYGHSAAEADAVRNEAAALGVQAWTVGADLAGPAVETLIDRAITTAGALDILVNSAAIFPPDTLDNVTFDSVLLNARVNAWAPFTLSRDFARRVETGSIINLLDTRISAYDWTHVAYMMSKQMLRLLTRMCALEYAPRITVNAVAPGLILPPPGQGEDYLDRLAHTVPLNRHGDPGDIADAVVFLARSTFITGEVIYVDGGRHLKGGSPPPGSSEFNNQSSKR